MVRGLIKLVGVELIFRNQRLLCRRCTCHRLTTLRAVSAVVHGTDFIAVGMSLHTTVVDERGSGNPASDGLPRGHTIFLFSTKHDIAADVGIGICSPCQPHGSGICLGGQPRRNCRSQLLTRSIGGLQAPFLDIITSERVLTYSCGAHRLKIQT